MNHERAVEPPGAAPSRSTRVILWGILGSVIAAVGVAALAPVLREKPGGSSPGVESGRLPVYHSVPPFTLVERDGRAVDARDFSGRIWVANFIFTQCPGMCPGLSARMAQLKRRLREQGDGGDPSAASPSSTGSAVGPDTVLLVSFSVDPEHDTPEALRRYAERFHADEGWLFLTGPTEGMRHLIRDGFQLSVAEVPPEERARTPEPITHSDRFVLVDRQRRIRGYYHGSEASTVTELLRDIARLRAEGAGSSVRDRGVTPSESTTRAGSGQTTP
jgi:protein SCO1/2